MAEFTRGKNGTALIDRHPVLLTLFGARHPALSFLFAGPLLAVLVAYAWRSGRGAGSVAVEIVAGLAYWSLFEYVFHRWFYHWRPKGAALRQMVESFHVYHHRNPADRRVYNAGPLLASSVTTLLGAPLLAGGLPEPTVATVMIGTVAGYWFYEWCHYLFHVRTFARGWLARMQRLHLFHHNGTWASNFGVTNPFWDKLFRTMRDPNGR